MGMRMQQMGDSARLRVDHEQRAEGNEIEQIPPRPAQDERRHQQHEQIAVRGQAEAEQPDCERKRRQQPGRGQDQSAAVELWLRRAPLFGGLAPRLAFLVRAPFWKAPLTADEGGYAEVARLWSHGATLYRGAWVDRPQGLVLVFRALHLFGGSPVAMRAAAAVIASLVVAATMLLTLRLAGGRITAAAAGMLAATVGASPFLESFTLSGELLGSMPAVLSLLCFCAYLGRRRLRWVALAGVLTGVALLMKQSAFDGGLAAVAFLLWRERRRGVAPAAILVSAALVPVGIAAASA